MLYGVEVRRLDAVDHGVELHGLAQRGVCVAVYVAKKILVGKKSSTPWIMAPSSTPQITASSSTPQITAPSCSIQKRRRGVRLPSADSSGLLRVPTLPPPLHIQLPSNVRDAKRKRPAHVCACRRPAGPWLWLERALRWMRAVLVLSLRRPRPCPADSGLYVCRLPSANSSGLLRVPTLPPPLNSSAP